jgi:hypothetical protein
MKKFAFAAFAAFVALFATLTLHNPAQAYPNVQASLSAVGNDTVLVSGEEFAVLASSSAECDWALKWDGVSKAVRGTQFQTTFTPTVFAIEDLNVAYDRTASRVSGTVQFVYQKGGGSAVVAVMQNAAIREQRTIDYTPVHNGNEFAAEADVGFAVRERAWSRTVAVLGSETPKKRIGERADGGNAGLFDDTLHDVEGIDSRNDGTVQKAGWNIIQNNSQVATEFIGMPGFPQIEHTILTETVVERWHEVPAGGGGPHTPGLA